MLSYRHGFHAGNLADVLKHATLVAVLDAALAKPTPLVFVDTHAGAGAYRLDRSVSAQAEAPPREHLAGISALRAALAANGTAATPPTAVTQYLACVAAHGGVDAYPGSPLIAAHLLRSTDRLLLAELHPTDRAALVATLGADPRVSIAPGDGYAMLKATLPPRERRGVVLVDPAYELDAEPAHVVDALRDAFARFRHGVYVVWYPLRGKHDAASMKKRFVRLHPPKTLCLELEPKDPAAPGALASGVWIVNPPFSAVAELEALTTYLGRTLVAGGRASCQWLVAEA